jgi:tripartite-type tricarboxylate transporter receptor subunit TctC
MRAMPAALIIGGLFMMAVQGAQAQSYPTRPVRIVAASAPGGGSDILARLIAQKLTEEFKQQVLVENRAGASGIIGTEFVAKAPADGYTLLLIQPSLTINPSIFPKLPYDAIRDFAPITNVVDAGQILTLHPSVPAQTVKDLIALARARPGHLTIGSPGAGTSPHLAGDLFQQMAGVKMQRIIYKGVAPALIGLISGEVAAVFSTVLSAMPHVKSGKARALGVTTVNRLALLPEVPTISESGLPGYESSQWFGILAPAGTPRPVIDRLHEAITRASRSPDVKEKLAAMGVELLNSTPEQFAATIKEETARWARVIKAAGGPPTQ